MNAERELVRAFEANVVAALDEVRLWLAQNRSPALAEISGNVQWALSKARRGFAYPVTFEIVAAAYRTMAGGA